MSRPTFVKDRKRPDVEKNMLRSLTPYFLTFFGVGISSFHFPNFQCGVVNQVQQNVYSVAIFCYNLATNVGFECQH